ncbi:unnamed protein product, partial [Ectocarpus sp. 6 AP-2014]
REGLRRLKKRAQEEAFCLCCRCEEEEQACSRQAGGFQESPGDVIVESPATARTISELLEKAAAGGGGEGGGVGGGEGELYMGYTVDAWNGNVMDLVGKRRDVLAGGAEGADQGLGCGWRGRGERFQENDLEPLYIQNPMKKAIITRLRAPPSAPFRVQNFVYCNNHAVTFTATTMR